MSALPTWDMTPFFPSLDSPEFSAAFEGLVNDLNSFTNWIDSNKIDEHDGTTDAEAIKTFEEAIERLNSTYELAGYLESYIYGFVSVDSRDELALSKLSELESEMPKLRNIATRLTAWTGKLNADTLIANSTVAKAHEFHVRRGSFLAKRLMSGPEESLASELAVTGAQAWAKLHSQMTSQLEVDIELDGQKQRLPMSAIRNLANDTEESKRAAAYHAELAAWKTVEVPLAAAMNSIKGESNLVAHRRGWGSVLDVSVYHANIDSETLWAMLNAAEAAFPVFRRYMHAKAKLIGKHRLAFYDIFAPVGKDRDWAYEEGENFVAEKFGAYSDKMRDFARRTYNERWIDAGPRPGKVDGAFCMPVKDDISRVLMNYNASFRSVSTLAHELGHAYHGLCLHGKTALQKETPMTLAETASIFCETIIKRAALREASAGEKLAILEGSLQGANQTVVDISSRFRFEKEVLERRQKRELSPRELCDIMLDAQRQTYGDGLDENYLHGYMWAAKPHYYSERAFYNFPYMFGLLFSLGLYAKYEADPEPFKAMYDDLLGSTGMADAATLAARFGINTRERAFWEGSLRVVEDDVKEFEALVNG